MANSETRLPLPLEIRTATPSSVRAVNRSIMLGLIRRHQPVSRADLARLTGVFRSSVSDIVDELVEMQLVTEERSDAAGRRGRTPTGLRLNEDNYPVLGLNVRPRYSQLAFAGLSGRIQRTLTFETPSSPKRLVRSLARAVADMRTALNWKSGTKFRALGVAIPGHVDALNGQILWVPTHHELNDFPIARSIESETGIPAFADNDCNLGALSELWLSSENRKDRGNDFVFLNVSDFGTGAGVVVNGEIYRGHDGRFAAEVGHMVVYSGGERCSCGRKGCWERYVSNEATWRRVFPRAQFSPEKFTQLLEDGRIGDRRVLESFDETADYLALGVGNIVMAFNPAEVVIAGRITTLWGLIESRVNQSRTPGMTYAIRPAHLSADDSLLHGAVCFALNDVFAGPKFG
jgi:predicted NBD/HSP70 family sugar kinase